MDSKSYRSGDFIRSKDKRSLIVDTSAGLALGTLAGLEDFEHAVGPVLPFADGMVCSPGQLRRLSTRARDQAGLLVRMEWTNTLRDANFVLPPIDTDTTSPTISLTTPAEDAVYLLGQTVNANYACQDETGGSRDARGGNWESAPGLRPWVQAEAGLFPSSPLRRQ